MTRARVDSDVTCLLYATASTQYSPSGIHTQCAVRLQPLPELSSDEVSLTSGETNSQKEMITMLHCRALMRRARRSITSCGANQRRSGRVLGTRISRVLGSVRRDFSCCDKDA